MSRPSSRLLPLFLIVTPFASSCTPTDDAEPSSELRLELHGARDEAWIATGPTALVGAFTDAVIAHETEGDGASATIVVGDQTTQLVIDQAAADQIAELAGDHGFTLTATGELATDGKADGFVPRGNRGRIARAEIGSYNGLTFDAFVVANPATRDWVIRQWDGERSFTSRTLRLGGTFDRPVLGDYDDDGQTDPAMWRAADGGWRYWSSKRRRGETMDQRWGGAGDVPVPGDYDGDLKTDLAIYRAATREYWVFESKTGRHTSYRVEFDGTPVPADYDGDGKTDAAIWRAGSWWIRNSNGGSITRYTGVGAAGDRPRAAMYDEDSKADPAVFNTLGWWSIQASTNRYAVEQATQWGYGTSDVPCYGDHDGDGLIDFTVFRPSDNTFYSLGIDGNRNPPPRMRTTMPAGTWQPVAGTWNWRPPIQL